VALFNEDAFDHFMPRLLESFGSARDLLLAPRQAIVGRYSRQQAAFILKPGIFGNNFDLNEGP